MKPKICFKILWWGAYTESWVLIFNVIRNLNDCVGTYSLLGPKPQTSLIFHVVMEHQLFILSVHLIADTFTEMPFGTCQSPHHNKLWKILQEMGVPEYLTCLLRNLYAGQEATVRTGHGTGWFKIGKGVRQDCILSPCLFNLYAEYIMRNAGLDEAKAGIKIARRNINNLRYVDDTMLWQKVKKN